jgi:DNA-binding CsgD family transcriptional regulator
MKTIRSDSKKKSSVRKKVFQRQNLDDKMLSSNEWRRVAKSLHLSTQELKIVKATFRNQTEYAIAANLKISTHTVHTHFERLYHKLAVKTRAQLILRVFYEYILYEKNKDRIMRENNCKESAANSKPAINKV